MMWIEPLISMAFFVVIVSISAAGETYRISFDRFSLEAWAYDPLTCSRKPDQVRLERTIAHLWVGKMGYKHDFTHHLSLQYWRVGES